MSVPNEQKLVVGFDRLRCHLLNLAELIFLDVLKTAPDDGTALRLLGVTRCKMGWAQEGVENLRAAAEREPGSEVIWNDLAVALRDAGEPDGEAARERAQALRDATLLPLPPLDTLAFGHERAVHRFELVDYPYVAGIRHGSGRPPHPELTAILETSRGSCEALIDEMGALRDYFTGVPLSLAEESVEPVWLNTWFSGLDAMALTAMLKRHNPARFVEIGSGVSTKFARRAVSKLGLRTRLVSIDPEPRKAIDDLCDQVIRKPLEACDTRMFDTLGPDDILFLDSSHRAFQGSDVTVFFTEILPRLKPGVIVHVHDIYLPEDYIAGHLTRLWNEQYVLATALLFGADRFEILFPCWWAGRDPALVARARDRVCHGPLERLDLYGASFWMRVAG